MFTTMREEYVRHALERSLDEWEEEQKLPSLDLLRNGLTLLENGGELDRRQRTLLLRTALRRQKGIITALRHQNDPERTALLLSAALLEPESPFSADDLTQWRKQDIHSDEWRGFLHTELLAANQTALLKRKSRISNLLAALAGRETVWAEPDGQWALIQQTPPLPQQIRTRVQTQRALLILLILAFSMLASFRYWPSFDRTEMVAVTAVLQPISPVAGGNGTGLVAGRTQRTFQIDVTEVTNRQYRRCVSAGNCPWPTSNDSLTHKNYFIEEIYDQYPVIHVDASAAEAYCTWLNKRLPTAEEWEVAASLSPATGRRYRYPWGDPFEEQFATSAASNASDVTPVGSHRPTGSSPLGVDDMAGNVAEWTATPSDSAQGERMVKGGSFQDGADLLLLSAQMVLSPNRSEPWLGFRCVKS